MDEKFSRVEKNSNLYIVDDHKLRFLIYYVLLPLFIFLSMIVILTDNVSAADYSVDVTDVIYTGTENCLTNQKGICSMPTSGNQWGRYVIGDTDYAYTGAMNFVVNQSVLAKVNATIRLTATYWSNVNYTCVSSFSNCRVVRANHNILNINFSNLTTHSVSGGQFLISASGDPMNANNPFKITKVTLYETFIEGDDSVTGDNSDIISNQNQNTQDIINNINQSIEEVTSNLNSNFQDTINSIESGVISVSGEIVAMSNSVVASNDKNANDLLNNTRNSANADCKNFYRFSISYGKKILNSSGVLIDSSNNSYYTEQYINIDFINSSYGDRLGIKNPPQSVTGYRFILYDSNFNFISTTNIATRNVVIPSNAQYFRFASPVSDTYVFRGGSCVTATDEINNTITSDNVSGDVPNSFFDDFSTTDFNGISRILTKPMVLVNNMLSSSNSCSSLQTSITIPSIGSYGGSTTNIELPSGCVLWNNVPNSINLTWQAFTIGLACYFILKDLLLTSEKLEAPHDNKTEVMKL